MMKRSIFKLSMLALAALLTFACQKTALEQPESPANRFEGEIVLHARWGDGQATKTAIQSNRTSVWWTTGEELYVFYGTALAGKFTSQNTEPAPVADFMGTLSSITGAPANADDMFWAVYPYNESIGTDGLSVSLPVPASQSASEGTFADKLFPAVAQSAGTDLEFHNVCGGACFSVSTPGIRSVTFVSRNGEYLAGTVRVMMEDGVPVIVSVTEGVQQVSVYSPSLEGFEPGKKYYAVLIPQTLSGGMDVQYRTSSKVATYTLEGSIPIVRSKFGELYDRDANLNFEDTPVDRLAFQDPVFADYVFSNFDTDQDGELSETERRAVKSIRVNADEVTTLTGIEYFPELQTLQCMGSRVWNDNERIYEIKGRLTSLDLSANTALISLDCRNNQLETLDVSALTSLNYLACEYNKLSALDVSQNTALTELYCYGNRIEALNVSALTVLSTLHCAENQITSLDASANTALTRLYCRNNQLTSLKLPDTNTLTILQCYNNLITTLDVSHNTALTELTCYSNQITALDLSTNTALTTLYCYENQLGSLVLPADTDLSLVSCFNNQLTALDVSANTGLKELYCNSNQISSLDLPVSSTLHTLNCSSNKLTTIDVSGCPSLIIISVYENQLSSLDVTKNENLEELYLWYNPVGTLDVTHNAKLKRLDCEQTGLTVLDLSGNPLLEYLYCSGNKFVELDVSNNPLLSFLYCVENENLLYLYLSEGQTIRELYKPDYTEILYARNLSPEDFPDASFRSFIFTNFDKNSDGILSDQERKDVEEISMFQIPLSSLNGIEYFPNLQRLYVIDCQLTAVDISYNTKLTVVQIQYNELNALDVTHNEQLIHLDCGANLIGSLDLSRNKDLEYLYVGDNKLTALDLSRNPLLKELDFHVNAITDIDLSRTPLLEKMWCYDASLLAQLDLSNNPLLSELHCQRTALTELDITGNLRLKNLHCEENPQLEKVRVAAGHTFDTLVKDDTTAIIMVSSGDGGKGEGYGMGEGGGWDN